MTSMDDCTKQELHDGQRIMNKDEFRRKVGRGSHVAEKVCRSGIANYYHHFLVTKVEAETVDVIHYAKTQVPTVFRVQETPLRFDQDLTEQTFERGVYLIWSEGYPESEQEIEAAILRALSRLGEKLYMMAINNCEHFVTWALTQRPCCRQIQDAKPLEKCGVDIIDACCNTSTVISKTAEMIILTREAASNQKINQSLNQALDAAGNKLEATAATKANSETTDQTTERNTETMDDRGTGSKSAETDISKKGLETGRNTYLKAAANNTVGKIGTTSAEIAGEISIQSAGEFALTVAGTTVVTAAGKKIDELVIKSAEKSLVKSAAKTATMYTGKTTAESVVKLSSSTAGTSVADTVGKTSTAITGKAIVGSAKNVAVTTAQTAVIKEAGKDAVETAVTKAIPAAGNKAIETTRNLAATTAGKVTTEKAKKALAHRAGTIVTKKAGKAAADASGKIAGKATRDIATKMAVKTAQTGVIIKRVGNEAAKKVGRRGTYVSPKIAVKTAQKAGESATNAKSLLKSTAKAAAFTAVIEGGLLAKDLYDLKKARDNGHISERDFKRGTITKTSGAVGSVGGAVLGQIIFPIPGFGAVVGGLVFGALGKAAFSTASGILFDNA